jgi:predicted permease
MPQKLKSGARVSGRNRLRRGLAVVEIATALILLAGAGLLIKSFYRLIDIDPGFRSDHVLTFEVSLPEIRYPKAQQNSDFFRDFVERLKQHGEVQSAAAIFGLPLSNGYNAHTSFELTGKPAPVEEPHGGLRVITPEYFQTMRIPILSGRNLQSSDQHDSDKVLIISESAAKLWFPNENPLGQKIRIHVGLMESETGPRTIIGVVHDVRFDGLDISPQPDLYIPHTQQPLNAMMMTVRTSGDPINIVPVVREELRRIDPNLPLSSVETMDEVIGESISQRKFTMFLLSAFAGIGLFLAALGTYGVLAFQVVQRTQEIGIRIALGAAKKDVLRLVLQEGLFLAVTGTLIGILGVLGTSRFLKSLLFNVSTVDAGTFGSVVILLAAVAMFACYIPALRATKVDPITTLHYE